jgi:hypothetical protein
LLRLRAFLLTVDEVLLAVGTRLLTISALGHRLEIFRHRIDRASQLSQLLSDTGNVLVGRHVCGILRGERNGRAPAEGVLVSHLFLTALFEPIRLAR